MWLSSFYCESCRVIFGGNFLSSLEIGVYKVLFELYKKKKKRKKGEEKIIRESVRVG